MPLGRKRRQTRARCAKSQGHCHHHALARRSDALGTTYLEETEAAVKAQQAVSLLPLWQAIQDAATQGDAQVNEFLAQVEQALSFSQLASL